MHWLSIGVAVCAAIGIIVVGIIYLLIPMTASQSFGLPSPGNGPNIVWWLRLKGSRDVVSGLVVFALLAEGEPRLLGIVLLILALVPIGDMSLVLSGKGSTRTAFGVHGLTAVVMIDGAIPLITGLA